jgi:hypothetical protein
LVSDFRARLGEWQTDLNAFTLTASTAHHPGKAEIDAALSRIAQQLAVRDSFAFIEALPLEVAPAQTQGDVTVIAGQAWPSKVSGQRDKLIESIRKDGFEHTMEAVAYTWFNRFAALRYMELHDYLGHGHRALSSTAGGLPDILTHATDLSNDLPGLNAAKVTELKLAGNRDGELYRMLLVAQCNALSRAMPFLFERIDDDSELLLPDNLLRSDSVISKLVAEIPEEDWVEVEIIGWLYQFYISEKKDQVIGKVVKSEDIPAATQLFTPNWIVQYLVQNSVGRLWLMANPQSSLTQEWPYYITPAEQTPEVQSQLDALIQTRVREDGDTLNPESITVMDPACGSGHILVVAYDVLKAIYLERGYQPRAIPRLILEKNLYGLDIDDRAAQMAGFALLMKARADDRRLFTATDAAGSLKPPKLNVLSLQESKGLSLDELATHLAPFKVQRAIISSLLETFEHAKTFGSLIQIPYTLKTHLVVLPEVLALVKQSGELYATAAADDLLPLVQQAQVLAMQFDAVVANPPYMGARNGMNPLLKSFAGSLHVESKADLFSMFIERGFAWCKSLGFNSMVTMQSWMFLSSYEEMRYRLLRESTLTDMVHMGNSVMGIAFGTAATVFMRHHVGDYQGRFSFCDNTDLNDAGIPTQFPLRNERLQERKGDDFKKISGSPIAYWVSPELVKAFENSESFEEVAEPRQGMATGNNSIFVRAWQEINFSKAGIGFKDKEAAWASGASWVPYNKGGEYRKWYGNNSFLLRFDEKSYKKLKTVGNHCPSERYYFRRGVTWGLITSADFSCRYMPDGFVFDVGGSSAFPATKNLGLCLALLNSKLTGYFIAIFNPTVNTQVGDLKRIPILTDQLVNADHFPKLTEHAIGISKEDWDSNETSWDFQSLNFVSDLKSKNGLAASWRAWSLHSQENLKCLKGLEEESNSVFIAAYGLQDDLSPEVTESQITLARADREKDCHRLISYAIGCMMGRYSLDEPGLIYAHEGNVGFEPGRYATFPADADGIVPITDELWFADDAPSRIREFLRAVWGPDNLEENMAWLAESLVAKASETPDETVRRYIADKFFKDHLQTYKKLPIYWLFSSGKQGAFQALVYLHRYHEGTIARLRAEYVVPLTGKIQSRIEMLQKDVAAASSTAARNKLAKEVEKLKKKHVELLAYDEQMRHFADMRITLDLDDGVKVNYGKFGDLLAEVKAVTGGASDD